MNHGKEARLEKERDHQKGVRDERASGRGIIPRLAGLICECSLCPRCGRTADPYR